MESAIKEKIIRFDQNLTKLETLWESLFDCGKSVGLCFNQDDASPCPHLKDNEPDRCCAHCEKRLTCNECCPLAKGE